MNELIEPLLSFPVDNRPAVSVSLVSRFGPIGKNAIGTSPKPSPLWLLLLLFCLCAILTNTAYADRLQWVRDLPLPGQPARFDYETLDPANGRLYINHMGANRVLVYDVRSQRLLADLPGIPRPTGITLAAQSGLAFVSATGSRFGFLMNRGHVLAIRLSDLTVVARLPADGFPDGSAWAPPQRRLFVSNERGGVETVIGVDPMRVIKTLALNGEAGNSAYDPIDKLVWVNVQSTGELVAIEPQALNIVRRIKLPPSCVHNHGLLIDDAKRLAFVACDGNARLLTLALPGMQTIGMDAVGKEPDVLALDTRRQLLYIAAESGIVSVFSVAAGKPERLWRGWVGPDAHSVAVDPESGLSYFPLDNVRGHPLLRVMRLATP